MPGIGAKPATSMHFERPLCGREHQHCQGVGSLGPQGEQGRAWSDREVLPCPRPTPSNRTNGSRHGTRGALSARNVPSSRRKSGISGPGFKSKRANATSRCSTWQSTANCGAATSICAAAGDAEASMHWRWQCAGLGFEASGEFTTEDRPGPDGFYSITGVKGKSRLSRSGCRT
jgi:hypothetical protein